jgi:repressor LexA
VSRSNPTKKQRELLDFISKFTAEHGYNPSYREIMNALEYKSVSTVATHINNLVAAGLLKKADHSARSLEVVGDDEKRYSSITPIKQAQEKWLVDIIKDRFKAIENKKPSTKEIDDLFVLVGALHVLGLKDVAKDFKIKLLIISNQTG